LRKGIFPGAVLWKHSTPDDAGSPLRRAAAVDAMRATRFVKVRGVPVRCLVLGHGKPLVLLHGLAGSSAWWHRNLADLGRHHRVYFFDLPGFGGTARHGREFTLAKSGEWLGELLDVLGLSRPSILGYSMGALIAVRYAASRADALEKLVLVAPAIGLPHRSLLTGFLSLIRAAPYISPSFAPVLVFDALRAGPLNVLRAAVELLSAQIGEDLRAVRAPVLLLFGERDNLVPVSIGYMLQKVLQDSRLRVIPRAGHVLMHDRPLEFNQAVLEFLSEGAVAS
jgi:pimeloyl-ACP methyl ester carboxylesterase